MATSLVMSCHQAPREVYGFIATLGNDTVSAERVTRQANSITTDEVDRFPRVHVRHTVIRLQPDGSIRHLEMDIHTPSEPPDERDRKVVADVSGNEVRLTKTDRSGTVTRTFKTGGAPVVGHVPQMYSLYEIYFATALRHAAGTGKGSGKPVALRQFYIDREFDHFPLGDVSVTPVAGGKMEVVHDWLSGTGEATVDTAGQLMQYSGERTTYKVHVTRVIPPPDVTGIAQRYESLESQAGAVKPLSIRDTLSARIGDASFTVEYGRPLERGRRLLGDVIPYDHVWRTGANAATIFTTSVPIRLAGLDVPAGSYSLWTVPHTGGTDLIVNRQTGQWGTEYDGTRNLGIARMTSDSLAAPTEMFTTQIVPGPDPRHGTLIFSWGTFRWTAPVELK